MSTQWVWPVVAACAVAGCGSDSSAPNPPGSGATPRGLEASAPVAAPGVESPASSTIVYVSAYPGTVPGAVTAKIATPGGADPHPVEAIDGGFDPVAVSARVGDVLTVVLTDSAGSSTMSSTTVKSGRPPRVVRTSPSPRRTDVPLNAIIRVVFSAPMMLESVTRGVHLTTGGAEVPVALLPGATEGTFDLVPSDLLSPGAAYEIQVAATVKDVNGVVLGEAFVGQFTTSTNPGPAPVAFVRLRGDFWWIGSEWELAVDSSAFVYAQALAADGTPITGVVTFATNATNVEISPIPLPVIASRGWAGARVTAKVRGHVTLTARAGDVAASTDVLVFGWLDARAILEGSRVLALFYHDEVDGTIDVVALGGNEGSKLIAKGGPGYSYGHPMASATGSTSFVQIFWSPAGPDSSRVIIRRPDGSESIITTPEPMVQTCPGWSPDGRQLAFIQADRGGFRYLVILDVTTMSSRKFALGPAQSAAPQPCARWTLDGSGIGLTEDIPDAKSLRSPAQVFSNIIWNADGTGLRPPGSGAGEELYLGRVSPDGRWEVLAIGDQVWLRGVDGLSRGLVGFGYSPSFLP